MAKKVTLDEHRLWVIFHQTYDLITRYEESELVETGTTREQFLALWLMKFMGEVSDNPIKVTDLASSLYRSVNSTSSLIDRMEKNGLVRKVRDIPDRRAIRLLVTPKGDDAFEIGLKSQRPMIKRIFSTFKDEEIKKLLSLLRTLKSKVQEESDTVKAQVDPELGNPRKISRFLRRENF